MHEWWTKTMKKIIRHYWPTRNKNTPDRLLLNHQAGWTKTGRFMLGWGKRFLKRCLNRLSNAPGSWTSLPTCRGSFMALWRSVLRLFDRWEGGRDIHDCEWGQRSSNLHKGWKQAETILEMRLGTELTVLLNTDIHCRCCYTGVLSKLSDHLHLTGRQISSIRLRGSAAPEGNISWTWALYLSSLPNIWSSAEREGLRGLSSIKKIKNKKIQF